MFNWPILDVAIELVFVYTLLSLVCSSIKEGISRIGDLKAKTMEQGLKALLSDPAGDKQVQLFLNHPLIRSFCETAKTGARRTPPYIPCRTFAQALLDIVVPPVGGALGFPTRKHSPAQDDELLLGVTALKEHIGIAWRSHDWMGALEGRRSNCTFLCSLSRFGTETIRKKDSRSHRFQHAVNGQSRFATCFARENKEAMFT